MFRTHLEHSPTVDPFKAALFKLMGRVEPHKRNVPYVTSTTEDWLWFQLAMVRFICQAVFASFSHAIPSL